MFYTKFIYLGEKTKLTSPKDFIFAICYSIFATIMTGVLSADRVTGVFLEASGLAES